MKPINEKKSLVFLSWLSGMNGEWFVASSIKENKFSFNYGVKGYMFSAQQTHSFILPQPPLNSSPLKTIQLTQLSLYCLRISWWKRSLCLNGMESKPITNHSVIWIHSWIQWRKQPINQQQTSFHQLKESKLSFSLISFHLSLINGMELIKKYYNSKVAYYIHGQYDLLMEEGNWRNQINQLNLNGGCNAARHQQNQQITSISSSEWADWWFVVCCGGCGPKGTVQSN